MQMAGAILSKAMLARKARLLCCASARRLWNHLQDLSRKAVDVAELFADGMATEAALRSARSKAGGPLIGGLSLKAEAARVAYIAAHPPLDMPRLPSLHLVPAELVRHLIGNPFRPYQPPLSWPSSVVNLAQALYNQEPCHFALHDALLESGHQELADH